MISFFFNNELFVWNTAVSFVSIIDDLKKHYYWLVSQLILLLFLIYPHFL